MGLLYLNCILALSLLCCLDGGDKVLGFHSVLSFGMHVTVNCKAENSYEDYYSYFYDYDSSESASSEDDDIKQLRHRVEKLKSDLSDLKYDRDELQDKLEDCWRRYEPHSMKKGNGLSRKSDKKDRSSDELSDYDDEKEEKKGKPTTIEILKEKVRGLKERIKDLKKEKERLVKKLRKCREQLEKQTTTKPTTPKPIRTKKYIIRTEKVTWQESYDRCRKENKYLASFRTQNEQNALGQARRDQGVNTGQLWVAGFRKQKYGEFFWKGKKITPFTYTNWHSTEPSQWSDENQNCVESSWQENQYMWFVYECDTEYYYVCEYYVWGR